MLCMHSMNHAWGMSPRKQLNSCSELLLATTYHLPCVVSDIMNVSVRIQ